MMRLFVLRLCAILLLLGCLCGCWDVNEVQNTNYISAIGLDYQDGTYEIYAQLIEFAAIAKTESNGQSQTLPVWVGKGSGPTLSAAFHNMYNASQNRTFWGHVTALVYSRAFIDAGIEHSFDILNRYRELRYTIWLYGTEEPMEELFSVTPFFNKSPLDSILHTPEEIYEQSSFIRPLDFQQVIRRYKEPGGTVLLPRLSITSDFWLRSMEPKPLLMLDGIYALSSDHVAVFDRSQLAGVRWTQATTDRASLVLAEEEKALASLVLGNQSIRFEPSMQDGKVRFSFSGQYDASVVELLHNLDEARLVKLAEEAIEHEIRHTYAAGLAAKTDLFGLQLTMYRHRLLNRSTLEDDRFLLDEQSLQDLSVTVQLRHAGKFKATSNTKW